jgi:hypothetical protein
MAAYKRHVDTSSISDRTVARLSVYLRCVERLLDERVTPAVRAQARGHQWRDTRGHGEFP